MSRFPDHRSTMGPSIQKSRGEPTPALPQRVLLAESHNSSQLIGIRHLPGAIDRSCQASGKTLEGLGGLQVGFDTVVDDEFQLSHSLLVLAQQKPTNPSTAASSSASGTTRFQRFNAAARDAGCSAPSRLISLVNRRPISRAIRVVPPQPGVMPTSTSGMPIRTAPLQQRNRTPW